MSDTFNIVLCGVGGQGTVLASKLIAAAAMAKGMNVKSAETIGMAQRGGCVFSHVRIGSGEIHTPMIAQGKADLIIGFEPGEAVRMLPYLKKGGKVIVSSKAVMPVTASLSKTGYSGGEMIDWLKENVSDLTIVDTEKACEKLGSAKIMNVLLLGAAVGSGFGGITEDDIAEALKKRLPEKLHELNLRALSYVRINENN